MKSLTAIASVILVLWAAIYVSGAGGPTFYYGSLVLDVGDSRQVIRKHLGDPDVASADIDELRRIGYDIDVDALRRSGATNFMSWKTSHSVVFVVGLDKSGRLLAKTYAGT